MPRPETPPLPYENDLARLYRPTPPRKGHWRPEKTSTVNGAGIEPEAVQSGATIRRKPTPYYSRKAAQRADARGTADSTDSNESDEDEQGKGDDDQEESLTHDTDSSSYPREIQSSLDRVQGHLSRLDRPTSSTAHNKATNTTDGTCLARSVRSLSTSLRPRLSKPKLNLAEPVSSSTPVPVVKVLSALSARESGQRRAAGTAGHGEKEKDKKIYEWRTEVEENGDLARLEEKILKHVELEREKLREMSKREGIY